MLRFVFFSLLLVYSCQIFESKEINEISDAQFSEIQDNDHILVDVRTAEEYESGHIQDAVNFDFPILYSETLMGINFLPDYYVDITDYYELKKEAILKHKTQNPDRFVDLFELMNSYRAAQCNAPKGTYAEAYSFIPSFPFSDIREILPLALKLRPFHIENQHGFL